MFLYELQLNSNYIPTLHRNKLSKANKYGFFRESYLTLTNDSQTDEKILGTTTILNEILHQWFGNMVTTLWWDNAWLNEGICNYLNYYIMNKVSFRRHWSNEIQQ